jgi:hypothetical protein
MDPYSKYFWACSREITACANSNSDEGYSPACLRAQLETRVIEYELFKDAEKVNKLNTEISTIRNLYYRKH